MHRRERVPGLPRDNKEDNSSIRGKPRGIVEVVPVEEGLGN